MAQRTLDGPEAAKQLVNRAAAHLMRGHPAEALCDCEQALKVRVPTSGGVPGRPRACPFGGAVCLIFVWCLRVFRSMAAPLANTARKARGIGLFAAVEGQLRHLTFLPCRSSLCTAAPLGARQRAWPDSAASMWRSRAWRSNAAARRASRTWTTRSLRLSPRRQRMRRCVSTDAGRVRQGQGSPWLRR